MKVGYSKKNTTYARAELERLGVDEVFAERRSSHAPWQQRESFQLALSTCRRGDTLVVRSLDDVSGLPNEWLDLLEKLVAQDIKLIVGHYPNLTLTDWQELMTWYMTPKEGSGKSLKIISIGRETAEEKVLYHAMSKDPAGRQTYWQIFTALLSGLSLRRTAKKYSVSQATVYRIKQQMQKVKQLVWITGTFLVTLVSLQIARVYSNKWWIQFVIGAIATASVLYFTYSDMKED